MPSRAQIAGASVGILGGLVSFIGFGLMVGFSHWGDSRPPATNWPAWLVAVGVGFVAAGGIVGFRAVRAGGRERAPGTALDRAIGPIFGTLVGLILGFFGFFGCFALLVVTGATLHGP
jgi:amino acid permease